MCGIAGIIARGRLDEQDVARLTDTLVHRGPDDRGIWLDPEAGMGLGHRRLSIVDLSAAGHEPMVSASGRLVVTFNGEIYNHQALRTKLEGQGLGPDGGWRGHSDTETFLHAIECWGLEAALAEAIGMFAFGLWDRRERVLRLVRDRFGEKPLYYGWVGGDFLFASELKALRAHPRFDNPVDRQSLSMFLARNHVPAPRSIYRRIFKLEPASILTVRADHALSPLDEAPKSSAGGDIRLDHYWSYRDVVITGAEDSFTDEHEAMEALETALADSVAGQSMADVPIGAFLSGGIDSSLICAVFQRQSALPIRSFSIGVAGDRLNEADHAKAVASHLGTVHHEHYVDGREALDVIPQIPGMYDEPFADSSQIPTFLVSRFARGEVTVALTGDGGDELFGGYNRHILLPSWWNQIRRVPKGARRVAGNLLGGVPESLWSFAAKLTTGGTHSSLGSKLRKGLSQSASADGIGDVYTGLLDQWALEPPIVRGASRNCYDLDLEFPANVSDAARIMYADSVGYLPDDILCKVDRASMAVSLETRVPFLDPRVAAVAARIPPAMKFDGRRGKSVLRKLLYRHVPRELVDRPKAGFALPIGAWLRSDLRPWAESLLSADRLKSDGFLDCGRVRKRWEDHLSGKRESSEALWSILMFQAWLAEEAAPLKTTGLDQQLTCSG